MQLSTVGLLVCAAAGFVAKRSAAKTSCQSLVPVQAPSGAIMTSSDAATKLAGEAPSIFSLSAARGAAEHTETARGSRIVAYNLVKRKFAIERKQALYINMSKEKNYKGRRRNVFRMAKRAVMKSLKLQYSSRRLFKRERRRLWIMRVNANCKLHGVRYNEFICKLKEANININRKILSQLGVYDRGVFTSIMDVAIPNWKDVQALRNYVKPKMTVKEVDDIMIPHIEKIVPELYTDTCIRFNRQVKDWGIEYTVDMGKPESWRTLLPKMPELANFQLPDHFMGNANAETEGIPIEMVPWQNDREAPKEYKKFLAKVEKSKQEDEEKKAAGQETWPLRDEPLTRDAWFDPEPQSWF